ncbi:PepSY-associated TM helix domain protein, partial [Acidovorax delafieldii 2AN]
RLPDERQPAVSLLWRNAAQPRFEALLMHPQTGEKLEVRDTMGGDFFYRFHYELRTASKGRWVVEGRWVVGGATLLMFIALLTGIVTHRRIFKDFFTFRPGKGGQRAWMDAHNVTGVLVLPFYLLITFSGLMIFHTLYMPAGIAAAYPGAEGDAGTDTQAYFADLHGEQPARR